MDVAVLQRPSHQLMLEVIVFYCCWFHWQHMGHSRLIVANCCLYRKEFAFISWLCVLDKPSQWVDCCMSATEGSSCWRKLPSAGSVYTTNFSRITGFTACRGRKCLRYEIIPGTWWLRSGIFHTAMSCDIFTHVIIDFVLNVHYHMHGHCCDTANLTNVHYIMSNLIALD